MGGLRIRSLRDGFRRAGVAHPADWTDHPAGTFDAGQIAALKAEAMLIVEDAAPETALKQAPATDAPEKPVAERRTKG